MSTRKSRAKETYRGLQRMLQDKKARSSALQNEVRVLQSKIDDAEKQIQQLEAKQNALQEIVWYVGIVSPTLTLRSVYSTCDGSKRRVDR